MSNFRGNNAGNAAKKPKLDDWDDDLDLTQLDELINSTQAKENAVATQHTFSYTRFEHATSMCSSTQMDLPPGAPMPSQLLHWQEKYKQKEGEVTILRMNLKKVQDTHQAEKDDRVKEWHKNHQKALQDVKTKQNELEFKNLEIVNLQQQIADLKRMFANEPTRTQQSTDTPKNDHFATPKPVAPKKTVHEVAQNCKIQPNSQNWYPLKNAELSISDDSDHSSIAAVLPDLLSVMNLTSENLTSELSVPLINNIVTFQLKLLKELDASLCDLKLCSQILMFLSAILPINEYVQEIVLEDKLTFDEDYCCIDDKTVNYPILRHILRVFMLIKIKEKSEESTIFFIGVSRFLSAIFSVPNIHTSVTFNILQDIENMLLIYIEHPPIVIVEIMKLLETHSKNKHLVELFCKKIPRGRDYNRRQSVVESSCQFYKFAHACEVALPKMQDPILAMDVYLHFLRSVYNIFHWNASWLCPNENYRCDCLLNLFKLSIKMMHSVLLIRTEQENVRNKLKTFTETCIAICNLLFNSFDYMQKYTEIFARFKNILHSVMLNQHQLDLDPIYVQFLNKLEPAIEQPTEFSKDDIAKIQL